MLANPNVLQLLRDTNVYWQLQYSILRIEPGCYRRAGSDKTRLQNMCWGVRRAQRGAGCPQWVQLYRHGHGCAAPGPGWLRQHCPCPHTPQQGTVLVARCWWHSSTSRRASSLLSHFVTYQRFDATSSWLIPGSDPPQFWALFNCLHFLSLVWNSSLLSQ